MSVTTIRREVPPPKNSGPTASEWRELINAARQSPGIWVARDFTRAQQSLSAQSSTYGKKHAGFQFTTRKKSATVTSLYCRFQTPKKG